MWLKCVRLENFCNYESAEFELGPGVNIFWGENAQGKSNLIDGIYYLCFFRGVRGLPDDGVVRFGMDGFSVWGAFSFRSGIVRESRIVYDVHRGKIALVDRKRIERRSELIGRFPTVAMSCDDYRLTKGGPAERRRFMDVLLCQVSRRYLEDVKRYTAVLKQRNSLLRGALGGGCDTHLGTWTEQLVEYGCRVMEARAQLLVRLKKWIGDYFARITETNSAVDIDYLPSVHAQEGSSLRQTFLERLQRLAAREKKLGVTLLGPHRDDMALIIHGRDFRQYGSRGDHKAMLIALRLAEHALLQEVTGESPILLMDDLLVDLDETRAARLGALLPPQAQVIITSTDKEAWRRVGLSSGSFRQYRVQGGTVTEVV